MGEQHVEPELVKGFERAPAERIHAVGLVTESWGVVMLCVGPAAGKQHTEVAEPEAAELDAVELGGSELRVAGLVVVELEVVELEVASLKLMPQALEPSQH